MRLLPGFGVRPCHAILLAAVFSLGWHAPSHAQTAEVEIHRVITNWPDVELYYTARCAGVNQYNIQPSQITVTDSGRPANILSMNCPGLPAPCPMSVALVGDASGSMAGAGNAGQKKGFNMFVDSLGASDEAAVLYFNTNVVTAQSMTGDKAALHAAVNSIPASGGTALWDGVYAGMDEVINNGGGSCKAVILITDGFDNHSTHIPNEIVNIANQNHIHLCAVGLGSSINTTELEFITKLTGGKLLLVSDTAHFAGAMMEIQHFIRNYFEECSITLQAGCPDGLVHKLDLTISGVCGSTVRDTAAFRAPLDTSAWVDMQMHLTNPEVAGYAETDMELVLDTWLNGEYFEPLQFSLNFNKTSLELKDVFPSPGSLLGAVTVQVTPTGSGADITVSGPTSVTGSGPLLNFRFYSKILPNDTICEAVTITDANFAAGCYRVRDTSGELCILSGIPSVSCDMTGQDKLVWDNGAQEYVPNPFSVAMTVENTGNAGATGMRFRLLYDSVDVELIYPTIDTLASSSPVLMPGTQSTAVWQLQARTRFIDDSITLRMVAEFDNAPPVTCEHRVFIPASPLTLLCVTDIPTITADNANNRYNPMPFPVTVTVTNVGGARTDTVYATIILPSNLKLAGADAPDNHTKRVLPSLLFPQQSGSISWMVEHPLTSQARQYQVTVWVKSATGDSSRCTALVTIPAVDVPLLAPRCFVPDSLHFDPAFNQYVPNPFSVRLTCVNTGEMTAKNVVGRLVLPPEIELVDPAEPLAKTFQPSTLQKYKIGDPVPELSWMVRLRKRSQVSICPEFRFIVVGQTTTGVDVDSVAVSCCVRVPPVLPQWACALELPDSIGLNATGMNVEPNPFTIRYTITNAGREAGVLQRVFLDVPMPDGLSLDAASPMPLDTNVNITVGPNSTASFEWLLRVENRDSRRKVKLRVTAWDDHSDAIRCEQSLPIAAVTQRISCAGMSLDRTQLCAEGGSVLVTAALRNEGSVNVNDVSASLEWTDVGGTQYFELDSSFPDNANPKQRGVLFPQQTLQLQWMLRMRRMNTGLTPLTVQLKLRFGSAETPETEGDSICTATITILPQQAAPITVIGNNPACEGDTVWLDAGSGYAQYTWSTQDTTRLLAVTQSGEYHVQRSMGTEPHCAVLSDTVQVAFHPRPAVPVITRSGNTLTSTVADAYQWRNDSGDLPGATSRSYTATKNGRYAVMVTNSFGCSAVSDTVYVTLVGVEEARAGDFSIDVYPNPSRGVFTLSCSAGDRQQLRLTVRDLLGRVVSQRPLQHDGVHTLQRIDLSALPEGMYFLRLESAVAQHTRLLLLRRE